MKLPMLYKKTNTGAIQTWQVWTEGNIIKTAFGQLDGKIQITEDVIHEGKNVGRSNETTADEQAEAEARAYWEKKKKKNYVEELGRAENKESDVEGNGVEPMLAHTYAKQGHKIKWPNVYAQPKLDGCRIIGVVDNGKCTLWTRTRKPITGIPHIQRELEELFPTGYHIFDGEGYNDLFKKDFEQLVSFIRQENPIEGHEQVEYHIYDLPEDGTCSERINRLFAKIPKTSKYLRVVNTIWVKDEEEAMEAFEAFLKAGYEGLMLRNSDSPYVGKRSYDLQKLKVFDDNEFEVVEIEEGRGKLAGHVGAFVCKTDEGVIFKAKMMGNVDRLKEYFDDHSLWIGKKLQVKYQGKTNKENVPRFPVGVRIRDDKAF